jgi:hypothetical protein
MLYGSLEMVGAVFYYFEKKGSVIIYLFFSPQAIWKPLIKVILTVQFPSHINRIYIYIYFYNTVACNTFYCNNSF